jgi:hypothetical protein
MTDHRLFDVHHRLLCRQPSFAVWPTKNTLQHD